MIPSQISSQFEVGELIAKGAFACVYEGRTQTATSKSTKEKVALKIADFNESANTEPTLLSSKPSTLSMPRLYFHQVIGEKMITVLELLGISVYSLMQYRNAPLQLSIVLRMTRDVAKVLQWMHKKGYIHRDVKPDNILLGRGDNAEKAYLIDFSEAKKYKKGPKSEQVGNPYFISLNVLQGGTEGPKDDLESLITTAVYLLQGDLPWMNIIEMDEDRLQALVTEKKAHTPLATLCAGVPLPFLRMLEHTRSVPGTDMPNYKALFGMLKEMKGSGSEFAATPTTLPDEEEKRRNSIESFAHSNTARRACSSHFHHSDSSAQVPKKRQSHRRHTATGRQRKDVINSEMIPTVVTRCGPKFTISLQNVLKGRRRSFRGN